MKPLRPDRFPERYILTATGDCLNPVFFDGDRLIFDRTEACASGDYVAIFRDPASVRPGEDQVLVKQLVLDCRKGDVTIPGVGAGVLCKMHFPERLVAFRAEDVLSMHRCQGLAGPQTDIISREGMIAAGMMTA